MAVGNGVETDRQSRHRRRASRILDSADKASGNREIDRDDLRRIHANFYDGDINSLKRTPNTVRTSATMERSRPHKSQSHRRAESDVRVRRRRHSSSSEDETQYVCTNSAPRTPKTSTTISESTRGTESIVLDSHTIVTPENVGLKQEKTIYIDGKTLRSSKQGPRKSVVVEKASSPKSRSSRRSSQVISPEPRSSRRSSPHRPRSIVVLDEPPLEAR